MKIVAFTGESGTGKTTAIRQLIEHFVRAGKRVGAIKHTHHELNEENRGDTASFRFAGANPVILAGDREAVVFSDKAPRRIRYDDARDLLDEFATDIVLIEGFKSLTIWPRIELSKVKHQSTQELLAIVDRIWRP